MSLVSCLAPLEDTFSLGVKVGLRILNADLSNRLRTQSAVVNWTVIYVVVVAWLHQYMAFVALVLMYSRGHALWNTLTRGLQIPCTNV